MMTDPIADMLTRIRNAYSARRPTVEMPLSKLKHTLANVLVAEGYLEKTETQEGTPGTLIVTLKYTDRKPAIQQITRESTPGHRMYRAADELPRVLNDYGVAIISTPQGVMTNKEARKRGVGGEVICSVY